MIHTQSLGVVASRVWKVDAVAYKIAFAAVFEQVQSDHPTFSVGKSLIGIVLDWSDTQLKGLEMAVGKEIADKTMKNCQVSNSSNNYYTVFMCMPRPSVH